MTTLLHKTNAHRKAWAISSGFGELTKALIPTPRQGLASKQTSLISIMNYRENKNSTIIGNMTSNQLRKSEAKGDA